MLVWEPAIWYSRHVNGKNDAIILKQNKLYNWKIKGSFTGTVLIGQGVCSTYDLALANAIDFALINKINLSDWKIVSYITQHCHVGMSGYEDNRAESNKWDWSIKCDDLSASGILPLDKSKQICEILIKVFEKYTISISDKLLTTTPN